MIPPRLANRPAADAAFGVRLRTMRILWVAQLAAVGLLVLVSRFARADKPDLPAEGFKEVTPQLYAFGAAGLAAVAASFVVKSIFFRRAAEGRRPAQIQSGIVVALAMCEACALFGLMGLLVTWNDYAYLLFALGALGVLLHFPRRGQLEAAYYKQGV